MNIFHEGGGHLCTRRVECGKGGLSRRHYKTMIAFFTSILRVSEKRKERVELLKLYESTFYEMLHVIRSTLLLLYKLWLRCSFHRLSTSRPQKRADRRRFSGESQRNKPRGISALCILQNVHEIPSWYSALC